MQKKKHLKSSDFFPHPTRYRRDIRENSKYQLFHTEFVQISVFPMEVKVSGDNAKGHKRNIDINFIAQFFTHQEMYGQQTIQNLNQVQVVAIIMALPRCPDQF